MREIEAVKSWPFIHAYDACKSYLQPLIEAKKNAPRLAPLQTSGRVDERSNSPEDSDNREKRKNLGRPAVGRVNHA